MTEAELKEAIDRGEITMPTFRELAEKLKQVATEKSEWAGLPVPVTDYPFTIEPRYPYRFDRLLEPSVRACNIDEAQQDSWEIVNSWRSHRLGLDVIIQRNAVGRARLAFRGSGSGLRGELLIGTLAVSIAWLHDAETKAMTKLWNMVGHHKFTQYILTGTFLESSPRSGLTYMFRRCRPTLALAAFKGSMKVLCALCLHPIGYYHGSFGGCMVPTDDVIAHLAMMRGDEPKFWAHANQHEPHDPRAGL